MQWEKNVVKRTNTLINRYKNREAKINRFNAEDMLISIDYLIFFVCPRKRTKFYTYSVSRKYYEFS